MRPVTPRKWRLVPGCENLEGRRVLSTVAPVPTTTTATATIADLTSGLKYIELNGKASGQTQLVRGNPDVGSTLNLSGSGVLSNLGSVSVVGSLSGTGFTAKGTLHGSITLTSKQGSLTLQLVGPAVNGFHPPSSGTYTFSTVSETGTYTKSFSLGSVALKIKSGHFSMHVVGKPSTF